MATALPEPRGLHPRKLQLLALSTLGGLAVLGSYAWFLVGDSTGVSAMWGGIPDALRPVYTTWMFVAATGWFLFWTHLMRIDADRARVGRFGYGLFLALLAGILLPSAAWMPLTGLMLERPGPMVWAAIVGVLWIVGLSSLGLTAALLRLEPAEPRGGRRLAILGAVGFSVQTALLDALIWPACFPT